MTTALPDTTTRGVIVETAVVARYTSWAIVTMCGGCDSHKGPCPAAVRGPYDTAAQAAQAVSGIERACTPHVVPFWPPLCSAHEEAPA
ncbi:hypothetical protein ABIA39_008925 [Nocardia sp. GAS34]|uniref:hypothetical protein n=1 Tax=unclassified Nocardia TaxID=2637762 RepID=UPI003D2057CA